MSPSVYSTLYVDDVSNQPEQIREPLRTIDGLNFSIFRRTPPREPSYVEPVETTPEPVVEGSPTQPPSFYEPFITNIIMMDDLLSDDYEQRELRRSRHNDPIYELDQLFDGDPDGDDTRVRRKRNQTSLRYFFRRIVDVRLER